MGEKSVDISIIEYFKTGESLDKKKKKKILDLFKFLAGGESPTEVVEGCIWNGKACWKPTIDCRISIPLTTEYDPPLTAEYAFLNNLFIFWWTEVDFQYPPILISILSLFQK